MTSRSNPDRRRRELAAIHIAATELGLIDNGDDAQYRDMLWTVARVRSAAKLDAAGRQRVLDHLRGLGWSPSGKRRQKAEGAVTDEQLALIRHIWRAMGDSGELRRPGEQGLRAYVSRFTRHATPGRSGFSSPEFMTRTAARDIIEQLKKWAKRCNVDWQHENHAESA